MNNHRGSNHENDYSLKMTYNSVHSILKKEQVHKFRGYDTEDWSPRNKTTYRYEYGYGTTQPHAPIHIGEQAYTYDANGNQTGWTHDVSGQVRQILWDEENRIKAISDNGQLFSYIYDASGERVLKSNGGQTSLAVNGSQKNKQSSISNYTVYASPYLVLRNSMVTKHFYIESQRIATKLTESNEGLLQTKAGNKKVNYEQKQSKLHEYLNKHVDDSGTETDTPPHGNAYGWGNGNAFGHNNGNNGGTNNGGGNGGGGTGTGGNGGTNNNGTGKEALLFYYHPDHLGSSSYITDINGEACQHLEYFAFGETFLEEHSNTDRTPYLFNAKELDEETGLYYYGARYYDPRLSIWSSADELREKYPFASPYSYCLNNPVLYTDPDGKDVVPWLVRYIERRSLDPILEKGVLSKALGSTMRDIMKTGTGRGYISQFMNKGDVFYGFKASEKGKYSDVILNITEYNLQGEHKKLEGSIGFASYDGVVTLSESNGRLMINIYTNDTSIEAISHELFVHNAGEIESIIKAYKKGGLEAAQKEAGKTSADDDHSALRDLDSNHKGIKKYKELAKELGEVNPKYKKDFKKIEATNKEKYEDIKKK